MFLKSNPEVLGKHNSVKANTHTGDLTVPKAMYEKLYVSTEKSKVVI